MVMLGKFDKKNRDMQINPLFFILKVVIISFEGKKVALFFKFAPPFLSFFLLINLNVVSFQHLFVYFCNHKH